jgi:hypothetical protein
MAVKAGRRLYINGDRSKVVENGDPEAVALYATATTDLFDRDIIRYGIVPGPTPPSHDREDDNDETAHDPQDEDDGGNDEGSTDTDTSEAGDGTEAGEGDDSDEAATDDENVDGTTVVATAGARRGRRPA